MSTVTNIKAKLNKDSRISNLQKSLIVLQSRKPDAWQILSAVSAIEKDRIQDIATGQVEPDDYEITILEMYQNG